MTRLDRQILACRKRLDCLRTRISRRRRGLEMLEAEREREASQLVTLLREYHERGERQRRDGICD